MNFHLIDLFSMALQTPSDAPPTLVRAGAFSAPSVNERGRGDAAGSES